MQSFDGPIFIGFTSHFKEVVTQMPSVKVIILRMEHVPYIDQSGMYAIEDAVLELEKRDITVLVTGMQKQVSDMLKNIKLIPELIPEDKIFEDFETVKRFVSITEDCARNTI